MIQVDRAVPAFGFEGRDLNLKAGEEEQRAHAEFLEHFDPFVLGREVEYGGPIIMPKISKRATDGRR